ncbi:transposase [Streptomyces virginiae]|uniref:transposase n=1 Tax=Streptomyces virginiae TaxID=1961 RepID=UPI0036B6AF1E
MKNHPPELRRMRLYQSRPGVTIRQIAGDLGTNPETLRNLIREAGASRPRGHRSQAPAETLTPIEAENAALRQKIRELEDEREIVHKAAKDLAGETRW